MAFIEAAANRNIFNSFYTNLKCTILSCQYFKINIKIFSVITVGAPFEKYTFQYLLF